MKKSKINKVKEKLNKIIETLSNNNFLNLCLYWHGEDYLYDNLIESIQSYDDYQGLLDTLVFVEKLAIDEKKMLEKLVEAENIGDKYGNKTN